MPYQSHGFTIEDSIARNEEVYEVEFTRWGTRLDDPSAGILPQENLQFPPPGARPIPSSVAVAAIGPRSTVDRCWITWDRQKILKIPPADVVYPERVVSMPRIVTCDAPLLFPQSTRVTPSLPATQSWWDAMQFGTAYVFPWGPAPGFNPAGQGSGGASHGGKFGTTTGFYVGQTFVTLDGKVLPFTPEEEPFLQLLLYTKPPLFAPPARRAAMLRSKVWSSTSDPNDNDDDGIVAIYPIFGRKRVGISLISHNFSGVPAKTCDYTVGIIRNVNEDPLFEPAPLFEVKAAEALGVPGETGINIQLNNQCADYVVIHIKTLTSPAGGALTVVAED